MKNVPSLTPDRKINLTLKNSKNDKKSIEKTPTNSNTNNNNNNTDSKSNSKPTNFSISNTS